MEMVVEDPQNRGKPKKIPGELAKVPTQRGRRRKFI